jgi:hypothetical protein
MGSDDKRSGEICSGGQKPSGGASPVTDKAAGAGAEVGVLHSSVDLWDTTTHGEPREGTYPNALRRSEGSGDGSTGATSAHNDSAASIHAMTQSESRKNGIRKAGCGKTACPV